MPSLKLLKLSIAVLQRSRCWYITLRYYHDLWPLTLNICSVSRVETLYQIWTQSSNPRQSYCERFSGVPGPNFTKLAEGDHRYTRSLFQCSDTLLHFQTRATHSWVMLKTTPNFALCDRPPPFWKIREEWARLFNNTNSWSTT